MDNSDSGLIESLQKRNSQLERELNEAKEQLNWQNNRNAGYPTKGGFEFYINEEWTGLATAALDIDYGWHAALRKHRTDPDDERVRVRRVIEDDAILQQLTTALARVKELEKAALQTIHYCEDDIMYCAADIWHIRDTLKTAMQQGKETR